ncbi:MAG: hypothetical protein HRT58_01420 [Crocinitomicaceae bacterium]|nr:hypothetical protein [Flavobacteriales bacterium]NQZ34283.1 hypothetical protein [Crocinitomicaceae bacterium]
MTNYPTYRSPIRLLKELGISSKNIDQRELKLERKRLLLEIQLSDQHTTTIGKQEFTKNDVIKLFEELEGVTDLGYHALIYDHSTLLNLLENNRVDGSVIKGRRIQFNTHEETDAFSEFLSPYLTNAIDKLMSTAIREKNYLAIQRIQIYFRFLTPTDAHFAFQKFINFCKTLKLRLVELKNDQHIFLKGESRYLGYAPFYDLVNYLEQYYPSLPDTVAQAVISFTIESRNDLGRGTTLVSISDQAGKLNCSENLKSIINTNRDAFFTSKEEPASGKITTPGLIRIIALIILGIYALTKMFGSNDSIHSDENDRFLKRLEQLEQNSNQSSPQRKPDFDFTELTFNELHSRFVKIVENESYAINNTYKKSKPGIFSRYNAPETGTKHELRNQTSSDMIIAVWTDGHLNTFFVKRKQSIIISSKETSRMFFYTGKDWQTDKCIQSMTDGITFTTISGIFTEQTDEEFEFFRKYFTLTKQTSGDFTIKDENSGYELYQGDRFVNYSY